MNQLALGHKRKLMDNINLCPSHKVLSYDFVFQSGANKRHVNVFDHIISLIILCQLAENVFQFLNHTLFVCNVERS